MLEFLLNRLNKKFKKEDILIALAKNKMNLPIIKILKKYKIEYYEGSEKDVLSRYFECAKKFKAKNIVRITSDCPLIDIDLISKMIKYFKEHTYDYLANTLPEKDKTFPDGSDIEIFQLSSLKKIMKLKLTNSDKEHVTNKLWSSKLFKVKTYKTKKNYSKYRYSVDYHSDFVNVKKIINHLKKHRLKFTTRNIVNTINKSSFIKNSMTENIIKQEKRRKKIFQL